MGLTSWESNKTGGKIKKSDVTTAKNYLTEAEIKELNRMVAMFLDAAEDTALRRRVMYMQDWELQLDKFLHFNERQVLDHAGKISHNQAEKLAHERYTAFNQHRKEEGEEKGAKLEAAEGFKQLEKEILRSKKQDKTSH